MSLYVQHGFGKSDKIGVLAAHPGVGGTILSPKDENSATLALTASSALELGLDVLVDPQAYMYSTEPPGSGRFHGANGLPPTRVTWAQDASAVTGLVTAVGTLNARLGATVWIAPAPLQGQFVDEMTPLALQFARTAQAAWAPNKVYATVVIDQHALANWEAAERWLTEATTLDVAGFYLVIGRSSSAYPSAAWDPAWLSNYLRLIYVLGELAGYEVVLGYADYEGVVGLACGARAMASGWSYSLRQLCPERWKTVQDGGAQPLARLNMERVWSPVRALADAAPMFGSPFRSLAFSEGEQTKYADGGFEMDRPTAQVRHLEVLADRVASVEAAGGVQARLGVVESSLDSAATLISALNADGYLTGEPYLGRIDALRRGLAAFRSAEGV